MAIHGPNRIVVRDEKGNESVRRASHLKQCNLKDKVGTVVPKLDEYISFGRSTKLLLHPRDVPDLQFSQKWEDNSKIPPDIEVSTVECTLDVQRAVSGSNLTAACGEIPPRTRKPVKQPINDSNAQYIVERTGDSLKHGKFSADAAATEKKSQMYENYSWFQNPAKCVCKWSKALTLGLDKSMGVDSQHTAWTDAQENEDIGFSFFL